AVEEHFHCGLRIADCGFPGRLLIRRKAACRANVVPRLAEGSENPEHTDGQKGPNRHTANYATSRCPSAAEFAAFSTSPRRKVKDSARQQPAEHLQIYVP